MPSITKISSSQSSQSSQSLSRTTVLREVTNTYSAKSKREFGSSSSGKVKTVVTVDDFLDYVAAERLRRMPHRGSKWDKILQWAAYFASQTQLFQQSTGEFVSHSEEAARLILSNLQILLELGPGYTGVLEIVFSVFYNMGLTLSFFHRNSEFFISTTEVQQSLAYVFSDLVKLVVDVTAQYGKQQGGATTTAISTTEFHSQYRVLIESIYTRRDQISDYMWAYAIHEHFGRQDYHLDIEAVRSFLSPADQIVRSISSNRVGSKGIRAEFTCEWFQHHLTDFTRSNDNVFLVTGKAGCGKSYLSGWITERLQRAEGRKAFDTITYSIDHDIKSQANTTAVVKGLLLQLLDRNVGDMELYQVLCNAIQSASHAKSADELDEALWSAVDVAMHFSENNLMITIDGLDALQGKDTAAIKLLDRLHALSSQHSNVKAIVLSQPLAKAAPQKTRGVTIEPANVQQDIRYHVHEILRSSVEFRNLKHEDSDKICQRIAVTADGSFIWANLALEVLKTEKSVNGIFQSLEKLPKSTSELLKKVTAFIDLKSSDTRSLLAWLLASERPLTLDEIKIFYEIDLATCTHKQRFSEVEEDVKRSMGMVVDIHDNIVRFKHVIIRNYYVELAGSVKDYTNTGDFPFMMKEAHYDLSTRCLAYVKIFLTRRADPSFEGVSFDYLNSLFEELVCLEYASTYWISHFYQSPMYDPAGKHKLVPEFRGCFPDSVLLVLIETSKWTANSSADFELALTIRQTILTEKSVSTLQTLVTVARIMQTLTLYEKATTYYYRAYQLTQTLLGEDSDLLLHCAASYLTCSSTTKFTERTEVVIQREEMLKRVIRVHRETRGITHDWTIKYTRMLAELYTDTKQFDLAATTWKEIYEIYIEKYGQFSSETTTVYKQLVTVLEKSSKKDEISSISRSQYESSQSLAVTDERRFKYTWDMLKYYEERNELTKAEEVLVSLWRSTAQSASTSHSAEVHQRKIEAISEYVSFLKRHKRIEEAESILTGLWSEYKHSEMLQTSSVMTSMKLIAEQMRSFGMLSIARSVFSSMFEYFKQSGKVTSIEATSIATSLSETTQELVESTTVSTSTSTSTTTTTTSSYSEETLLEEAFESMTAMSATSTTMTTKTSMVKTSKKLSEHYLQQQRWTECYRVCSQSLTMMWSSLMTRQGKTTLPAEFQDEAIEVAMRMAECCFAERHVEKAESIYSYIFQATKSTLKLTDSRVTTAAHTLLSFYEKTYQYAKAVKVYEELYTESKTQLGASNARTIEIAYQIGDFCYRWHKDEDAERFYWDICTVLNKGQETVAVESVRAAKSLLTICERDARWESCETLCKQLWTMFVQRGSEARFQTEFVEKLYNTYSYILQEVRKVSYEEIYKLTVTYKETCTKVFGARNELTLKSTFALAQVCERSETHREESVSLYEAITTHSATTSMSSSTTSTAVITTAVSQAKRRLAKLYSEKTTTTSKAITMSTEEFESTKTNYGYTDERTLTILSDLCSYYASQSKVEYTSSAVQMLQSSVVETITKERSTEKLTRSATVIAQSFIKLGQIETAWEMLREIRRQVITGDYKSASSKFNFSVKGVDRRSYIFIIAFEQTLRGSSSTSHFSELMADLMNEALLYQSYTRAITEKSSFEITFDRATRLAMFYQSKKRMEEYNRVWTELQEVFAVNMKASKQSTTLREFFDICVAEIQRGHYEVGIVETSADRVLVKMQQSKFQEAYEIAYYVDRFVHLHGGWRSQQSVEAGFQICLHLTGRSGTSKASDKVQQSILELSRTILSECLRAAKDLNMRLIEMPVKQINSIVALLSEQQNFTDLEWLLTELWSSRHSQSHWDSVTIVWIGRRLVEVRFTVGKRDAAIHLCEDITYNLRRVWGPTDKTTLEMFDLLAEIYTAAGDNQKALAIHDDVLRQTLIVVDEDGDLPVDQGASVAKHHLELLKRSFIRNGGFGADKSLQHYQELFSSLQSSFGKDKNFDVSGVGAIDKWSAKDKADDRGMWHKPTSFELVPATDQKHWNNLRKTSGLLYGNGHAKSSRTSGHGHSHSHSYSYSSSSSSSKTTSYANGVSHSVSSTVSNGA